MVYIDNPKDGDSGYILNHRYFDFPMGTHGPLLHPIIPVKVEERATGLQVIPLFKVEGIAPAYFYTGINDIRIYRNKVVALRMMLVHVETRIEMLKGSISEIKRIIDDEGKDNKPSVGRMLKLEK